MSTFGMLMPAPGALFVKGFCTTVGDGSLFPRYIQQGIPQWGGERPRSPTLKSIGYQG